jgi:hypothetical protein
MLNPQITNVILSNNTLLSKLKNIDYFLISNIENDLYNFLLILIQYLKNINSIVNYINDIDEYIFCKKNKKNSYDKKNNLEQLKNYGIDPQKIIYDNTYKKDDVYMTTNNIKYACFCPCQTAGKPIYNSKYSNDKLNMYFMAYYYIDLLNTIFNSEYIIEQNINKSNKINEFLNLLKYCFNKYDEYYNNNIEGNFVKIKNIVQQDNKNTQNNILNIIKENINKIFEFINGVKNIYTIIINNFSIDNIKTNILKLTDNNYKINYD